MILRLITRLSNGQFYFGNSGSSLEQRYADWLEVATEVERTLGHCHLIQMAKTHDNWHCSTLQSTVYALDKPDESGVFR